MPRPVMRVKFPSDYVGYVALGVMEMREYSTLVKLFGLEIYETMGIFLSPLSHHRQNRLGPPNLVRYVI